MWRFRVVGIKADGWSFFFTLSTASPVRAEDGKSKLIDWLNKNKPSAAAVVAFYVLTPQPHFWAGSLSVWLSVIRVPPL